MLTSPEVRAFLNALHASTNSESKPLTVATLRLTGSRIRKAAALTLLAVGFSANADIGNDPAGPTLPDLNGKCFEELSGVAAEHYVYKDSFSALRRDEGKYSPGAADERWVKDKPRGYEDGYRENEWRYGPKGDLFGDDGRDYGEYCTPVPEPQTWALMVMGLLGLAAVRRGRVRSSAEVQTPRLA